MALRNSESNRQTPDYNTNDDPGMEQQERRDELYSVFTKSQKIIIMLLISIAGFFSPFTAFVYFPSLRSIGKELGVSLQMMNMTVTAYLIVQAIVPSFFGDLAKHAGRRPVYLLKFSIYTVASIGLALQRSYWALLLLRMLQSTGSSATIALAYAVISDVAPPHRRGYYVGLSHIGFNSAPALGPVIGGLLADHVGWPSIFIFLAAFGGVVLVLLLFFLEETARNIVGNGSIPAVGLNRSLFNILRHGSTTSDHNPARFVLPSIMPSIKLIFHQNTSLVLLSNAIFYMMYSIVQATLAPLVQERYGFTSFQAGLCYSGYGVAGAIASVVVGKITDHDYEVTANQHNLKIDRKKGDDLLKFPIEQARLRTVWFYISFASAALLGYGWVVEVSGPIIIVTILQFVVGFAVTGVFNVCNTLIVDVNPEESASASASVSITRCLTAAVGVAVVEPILERVGPGITFTIIAALCQSTILILLVERRCGWAWRIELHERLQAKKATRDAERHPLLDDQ